MSTDSDVAVARSDVATAPATYSTLFPDDANQLTVAGAIDDRTGPVAYLADLFALSRQLEEGADAKKACLLSVRRPDLPGLVLNNTALRQECPALDLVNELLEKRVALCTGSTVGAEERLTNATTPTGLPYNAPWDRVLRTLQVRGISLWRAVRHSDPEFPAFVNTEKPSKGLRDAVTMGCGFPPSVREMLVRPAITADTEAVALFSATPGTKVSDLSAVRTLMEAAGLKRRDIRHLLAVDGVSKEADTAAAVSLARFAPDSTDKASSKRYGAAFVNAGAAPLWIRKRAGSTDNMDTEIVGLTARHLDRMQRLLQVRTRLAISSAEADLLLCSALRAEKAAVDALPGAQTLRALGLYGHMKASTGVSPEQFVALLGNLPPYAIGRTPALLDSLIKVTEKPLTADDSAALVTALRIDAFILEQLLQRIEAAQKTRSCTLSVISACYRLVWLPRLLGLGVAEGLALLDMLEKQTPGYNAQIAGTPSISSSLDAFDILDAIPAYWNAAEWARQHQLSFVKLSTLYSETPPKIASDAWVTAVTDAAASLSARLLDATKIASLMRGTANDYDLAGAQWNQILSKFVDGDGRISSAGRTMVGPDLRSELSALLTKLKKSGSTSPVEDYVSALANAIADTAEVQGEAVNLMLQAAFGLNTEQVPAVLVWAGASTTDFLDDIMAAVKARIAGRVDTSTFSAPMVKRWHQLDRITSLVRMFALGGACLDTLVAHPPWFNLKGDAGKPASTIRLDTLYRLSRYQDWTGALADSFNETDALSYLSLAHAQPPPSVDEAATQLARLLGTSSNDIRELASNIGAKTVAGVAEDVADIDYVTRLVALQRKLGISVATLRDLNGLKATTDAAQVKRVAADLGSTLDGTQRAALESNLAEAWRDALCAWLLHFGSSQPVPLPPMVRPVDLSAYLLTDVEVGSEPRTTHIAASIASLQQYIHRLYARLEDGYALAEDFVTQRKAWREWRSQYALWQTYTAMSEQPSGFLDPSRRKSKSGLFEAFEKLVGQGKFAADEIQVALLAYLADFERISNIQPLSAYHDGVDPQKDTFHFIGRSNVDPAEYYWRTLDMSMRDTTGAPSMLAWGEWQRITLPATGVIVQTPLNKEENKTFGDDPRTSIDAVRPVVIAGRHYVVWLERDGTAAVFDGKPTEYYVYRLCYAYLQTDGQWSTANELIRLDGTDPAGRPEKCGGTPDKTLLKTLDYQPRIVVMVDSSGPRKDDPWLVALLVTRDSDPSWKKQKATYVRNRDYYVAAKDLLLVETRDIDTEDLVKRPSEASLVDRWSRMFDDPRVVQHRYVGASGKVIDSARDEDQTVISAETVASAATEVNLLVTKYLTGFENDPIFQAAPSLIKNSFYRQDSFVKEADCLGFNIPFIDVAMMPDGKQIRVVYGIDKRMALRPGPIDWPDPETNEQTELALLPSKQGCLKLQWISKAGGSKALLTFSDGSTTSFAFVTNKGDFGHYTYKEAETMLTSVTVYDSVELKGLGTWTWNFPAKGRALRETLVRATDNTGQELARFICKEGAVSGALSSEFLVERSQLDKSFAVTVTLSPTDPSSTPYATRTARLSIIDYLENDLQPDDGVPSVTLRCNTSRVHSLDFAEANAKAATGSTLPPAIIRLSTLFGKRLVALATH